MGDSTKFQVYEDITFQHDIIEHKVYEIILCICAYQLLASHESKASSHLHHKLLQVGDDGRLQLFLRIRIILFEA